MSVINKMLQDLDKRQQGHGLNPAVTPVLQYRSPARSKMPLFLSSIASVLLGAALLWGWQRLSLGATPIAPETQEQVSPQNHVAKAATEVVSEVPARVEASKAQDLQSALESELTLEPEVAREPQAVEPSLAKPAPVTTELAMTESTTTEPVLVEPVASESVPVASAPGLQIIEVRLTPSQLAAKRLAKAEEAERQGRLSDAVALYQEALGLDGSVHQARRQLAALFYGQDRLAQAAKLLEQGSLTYPQEFDLSLLLAKVQRAQGLTEVALATLDRLPDSGALAADKWILTGELAQAQGQWQRAEVAYRQLTRLEPGQARWWMGLGFALDSRAQYPDAVLAYKTALSLNGLSVDAIKYIDNRLLQLGVVDFAGQTGESE